MEALSVGGARRRERVLNDPETFSSLAMFTVLMNGGEEKLPRLNWKAIKSLARFMLASRALPTAFVNARNLIASDGALHSAFKKSARSTARTPKATTSAMATLTWRFFDSRTTWLRERNSEHRIQAFTTSASRWTTSCEGDLDRLFHTRLEDHHLAGEKEKIVSVPAIEPFDSDSISPSGEIFEQNRA